MLSDRVPAVKKYPWLRGLDNPSYCSFALEQVEAAIRAAIAHLRPVQMSFGAEVDGRVAFNRRYVLRDGTAEMFAARRRKETLHVEGPADPEVGIILLSDISDKPLAMCLHHTSHPTHGFAGCKVSADWPGDWCNKMEAHLGGTALVINGCCGNVHHWNVLDPHANNTTEHMGRCLTESALKATEDMISDESPVLDWASRIVPLPFRDIPQRVFDDAKRTLKEHPEPMWVDESKTRTDRKWCYAASLLDLEEMISTQDNFDYEIQVLRLGSVAIVVLMGEPFVEVQLDIKMRSPATRTFVAHMSNGYAGYIPTPRALEKGGYETQVCVASKFAPEALGIIGDATLELLNQVFPKETR